jgi:parallel beta-helix repeat protein
MKLSILKLSVIAALLATPVAVYSQTSNTASILPPAKTTFLDKNGNPLAAGTIDFYVPGTTTRKMTWQDAGQTIPNTNPVVLDNAGRGLILGNGDYRQIVRDKYGNLIWDQITSSTGTGSGGGNTPTVGDGDPVGIIKVWSGFVAPAQYAFSYGQEFIRTAYPELFQAITLQQNVSCTIGSATLTGLSDTSQLPIGAPIESSCLNAGATIVSKATNTITASTTAIITTATSARFFPYGNGDGVNTFNLPDLRGMVVAGRNNMGGIASSRLTTSYYGSSPDATGAKGGSQSNTLARSDLPNVQPTFSGTPMTASGSIPNAAVGISPDTTPGGSFAINGVTGIGTSFTTDSFTPAGTIQSLNGNVTQTSISRIQPSQTQNYIIKVIPDSNPNSFFGVASIGGMYGVINCGDGLTCAGNNISISAGSGVASIGGAVGAITLDNTLSVNSNVMAANTGTISLKAYTPGNTSNDTSGVQAAFNACVNCHIVCAAGVTYTIDTVTVSSNTYVDGSAGCTFHQRTQGTSLFVLPGAGATNITFFRTRMTGNLASGSGLPAYIDGDYPIFFQNSTNVTFDSNYVTRFGNRAFFIRQATGFTAKNNYITQNAAGIWLEGVNYFTVTNNTFKQTAMYSLTPTFSQLASAIALASTDQNPYGISSHGVISGNVISDLPLGQGIFAHAAKWVTVSGNQIDNVSQCIGFGTYNATDALYYNTITGNICEGSQATTLPAPFDTGIVLSGGACGTSGNCPLVGTVSGGSGYTDGIYGPVPLTGGSGSGATAFITIDGGHVKSFANLGVLPYNPGTGYVNGDVLSVNPANVGGTGSGFTYTITSYNGAGVSAPQPLDNTITGNVVHGANRVYQDPGSGCIYIGYTLNTTITGNSVEGCGGSGFVFVSDEEGASITGNSVRGIAPIGTTQNGFWFVGAPRVTLMSNMASSIASANGVGYRVSGGTTNLKWTDSGGSLLNGCQDCTTVKAP